MVDVIDHDDFRMRKCNFIFAIIKKFYVIWNILFCREKIA